MGRKTNPATRGNKGTVTPLPHICTRKNWESLISADYTIISVINSIFCIPCIIIVPCQFTNTLKYVKNASLHFVRFNSTDTLNIKQQTKYTKIWNEKILSTSINSNRNIHVNTLFSRVCNTSQSTKSSLVT